MNSETDQLPAPDKPQVKPKIKKKKKLRDWHGCDYSFRLIRSGKEFLVFKMHQFRAVSLHFFLFIFLAATKTWKAQKEIRQEITAAPATATQISSDATTEAVLSELVVYLFLNSIKRMTKIWFSGSTSFNGTPNRRVYLNWCDQCNFMFGTFALQTPTQHNRWVYTAMRDTYLTYYLCLWCRASLPALSSPLSKNLRQPSVPLLGGCFSLHQNMRNDTRCPHKPRAAPTQSHW